MNNQGTARAKKQPRDASPSEATRAVNDVDAMLQMVEASKLHQLVTDDEGMNADAIVAEPKKERNADIGDIDGYFETEIEECNFFMKKNKMTLDTPNLLWAFKSSIMAILFKPIIKFFGDMKSFSVQKIKDSSYLIRCFSKHIPLFISFDNNRIQNDRWSVHDINEKRVELLLRIDPSVDDAAKIIELIKNASIHARTEGWKGNLVLLIITSLPIAI